MTTTKAYILALLAKGAYTDADIAADGVVAAASTIRRCRNELVKAGKVKQDGISGDNEKLWTLVRTHSTAGAVELPQSLTKLVVGVVYHIDGKLYKCVQGPDERAIRGKVSTVASFHNPLAGRPFERKDFWFTKLNHGVSSVLYLVEV